MHPELTPLEARTFSFAINLAFSSAIQSLVERDQDVTAARKNGLGDLSEEDTQALMKEALADARLINQAFLVAGSVLEAEHGISA